MNRTLDEIITEIDSLFKCIQVDFKNDTRRSSISSGPGWYLIKTNAPLSILEPLNPPEHSAHINIPQTIMNNVVLGEARFTIKQYGADEYVIYNGGTNNLKPRAREHVRGHAKTFCLNLSNYKVLREYKWAFCYTVVSSCSGIGHTDKALRLVIEQGWRAKHGWPILCKK